MLGLQITCLGGCQATLAGAAPAVFPTDKSRALLVYLAVEGGEHSRLALAKLLWPGYRADSARSSLRQSLHRLRGLLRESPGAPPWFLLTRETVMLNPQASVVVDVVTFRQLLEECATHVHPALAACPACLARLRAAVDLYRGDFLAGFTLADSEPFEEWRRITQERLHIEVLDALAQLAGAAERRGDFAGALVDAQRRLDLEPWDEDAHCQVMRLLALCGRREAALAQYRRLCAVLAAELGAEPHAATTALYEQIRGDRRGQPPPL
jgi:DNA-binding SARP family transcriptional activator